MRNKPAQIPLSLEGTERRLPVLDERRRGTRFLGLSVRTVVNPPASTHMGFWSINPYVGCEFGCTYCYARDTHRYAMERASSAERLDPLTRGDVAMMPAWEAFEKRILVKTEVARVLRQTLDASRLGDDALVIGTATDPYQPAERRFGVTRELLEALLGFEGIRIGIITKSPLITRDLDVLVALADRNDLSVHISLATVEDKLARRLEARSPVPRVRLGALRALRRAGIRAGLLVAPILPGITDGWASLAALMEAGKEAGACWVAGEALRLGPAARARFFPVLDREFPELAEKYARHFGGRERPTREYRRALARRIEALQETYGFKKFP